MSDPFHLLASRALVRGHHEELECLVVGKEGPVVVLINGSGGPVEGWHRVIAGLSAQARVMAYHRPGVGKSPRPRQAQTVAQMTSSLYAALQALQLPAPYLLVGHSFGGLVAHYFTRRHPTQVRGVVLLEATAPADLHLHRLENRLQRGLRRLGEFLLPSSPLAETAQTEATLAQFAAAPDFPHLPLTVITGQKMAMTWATPTALLAARAAHQRGLVALSPFGRQVRANQSGHFPQLTEPDLVVREVLALAGVEACGAK